MKRTPLLILLLLLFSGILAAKPKETQPEIDYLGVAAVLIRDGNYQRAAETLALVDLEEENLDLSRFHTLNGLVQLRQADYEESLKSFQKALDEGQSEPVIYAYIAQSYFALSDYKNCLESLDRLEDFSRFPDLYGLKSQAWWYLEDKEKALAVLEEGLKAFPGRTSFLQQKIVYFIELQLYQSARNISRILLDREEADLELYLTLAESFRTGGEPEQSVAILEKALLLYPESLRCRLVLAQSYVQLEAFLTAAHLVEQITYSDSSYLRDCADLYRRAGQFNRARYLNTLLSDPSEKALLRFNIALEQKDYEEALSLIDRMENLGLLQEDSLGYAAAYVLFQVQQYARAIEYLNRIESNTYFRQASRLRQAIEIVKEQEIQYF